MFTRIVEMRSKPGKAQEVCRTIVDKMMPILKKQPGFLDEIVLVSEKDPNQVLGISFWNSKNDAETYHRQHFAEIVQIAQGVCEGSPVVQTYDVDTFSSRNFSAKKAA